MATIKKRKADEDDNTASVKSHTKKNRPSADNNQSGNAPNAVITRPQYSSLSFSTKSLTDHSHIWTPSDSFNSSLSSASSMTEYDSMSSSYGIVSKPNSSRTTTDDPSLSYNQTEEYGGKRTISPSLNGTPPQTKKIRDDGVLPTPPPSGGYSAAAARMMEKMGYDKNRGLGLNAQGPTKLIDESKQKGRRGLGFSFRDFNDETAGWNFDNDPAPIEEEVVWFPPSDNPEDPLDLDEMRRWIHIGPKKKVIDDEIDFCDEEILRAMLSGKTVFDELPQKEMEEARARSNVYETIGQSIFLNRAAVKIANIDLVFGRMFTEPKTPNERASLVQPDEPFYFADVCAGPGGFSEYILWKKQWRAKGFGFTLKGKSDFTLFKFVAGHPETFDPHYGVKDIEGDGDIFKSENIDAFQNYVYKCTMNTGVHIMMADGGFSVEGQENIQEVLSKQLYLCQFLTALSILRPGGHFVCKLFDLFTPFSIGLIYLMYRTFDKVTIHKPVTSRPANSERYIICKSLQSETRDLVRTYLYEINALLNQYKVESEVNDVLSIVPMDILRGNDNFYQYIRNSNNELGEGQIRNLRKIRAFVSNASLRDDRQHEVRTRCLQYWEVPDAPRQKPRRLVCTELQQDLFYQLGHGIENVLFNIPKPLKNAVLDRIQSLFDYRCVLALGDPVLLLSCGRSLVSALKLKEPNKRWDLLERSQFKIELPPYTLLLAELVKEQFLDARSNTRPRSAVYIIDAYFIANENMLFSNGRPTVFMDRYRALKLFEKTINKPARIDLVPIRISEQLRFEQMDSQFEKLCSSGSLEQIDSERLTFTNMDIATKPRVPIAGLWIFKFVQNPWTILLSKTRQMKYFHNQANRTSIETAPSDGSHAAGLKPMLEHSFYWDFQNRDDPVQKSNFIAFIQGKHRALQSHPQQSTTQN